MVEQGENFDDIIFTDESTFWVEKNSGYYYWQCSTRKVKVGKLNHPAKVHVWAGISRCGVTKLLIFEGIMRKEFFTDMILKDCSVPFIRVMYPHGCRLMMDNDPKHCSNYAHDFMDRNGVDWWRTPAESPDMNSTEHQWDIWRCTFVDESSQETNNSWSNGLKE